MLIVSRKLGEQILIGQDIEVVVLEIHGDHVKLGFTAPRHVPIFRTEVHQELADSLVAAGTDCSGRPAPSVFHPTGLLVSAVQDSRIDGNLMELNRDDP